MRRRRGGVLRTSAVVIGYLAAALFCWQHLIAAGLSTHMYQAAVGDVGQRVWFMGWLPFALVHGMNPFLSSYMFAPHGFNLLVNASVLFQALLFAPVTEIWSPLVSLNIACILAPVVSALSLYFVLRRYQMSVAVAFLGGLLYGFSPALLQADRLGDLNLSWMFFPPLALYLLDRIFFRQTGSALRLGLALGGLIVVQFFSSPEILLDCAVVALPVLGLAAIARPRLVLPHLRFAALGAGTALATAGAVLAYPLAVYLDGPEHVGTLATSLEPGAALPAPVWPSALTGHSFLPVSAHASLWHRFDGSFIGPVVVLLALGALFLVRRHRVILVLWVAALWSYVLSWGGATRLTGSSTPFGWHAPAWYLSRTLPILRNVGWSRIAILTDLVLVILACVALQALVALVAPSRRAGKAAVSWGVVLAAGLLAAGPFALAGRAPFSGFATVIAPQVLTQLPRAAGQPSPIALVYPSGNAFSGTPLAWQALAGFTYRDYGGYAWHPLPHHRTGVVYGPASEPQYLLGNARTFPLTLVLTPAQRAQAAASFAKEGVDLAVVVDGHPGSARLAHLYDQVFGPGRRFSDGTVWVTTARGRTR